MLDEFFSSRHSELCSKRLQSFFGLEKEEILDTVTETFCEPVYRFSAMKRNVLGMIEGKTSKKWVWVAAAAAVLTLLAAGDNSSHLLSMGVFLVAVDLEAAFLVGLNSIFDLLYTKEKQTVQGPVRGLLILFVIWPTKGLPLLLLVTLQRYFYPGMWIVSIEFILVDSEKLTSFKFCYHIVF